MLAARLELRIGKNGHRRESGELAKIADQMRLVEILGLVRNGGPIWSGGVAGETASAPEAQHATEALGSEAALFQAAAPEVPRAQISAARRALQIGGAMRRSNSFNGLLYGTGRVPWRRQAPEQDAHGVPNGFRVVEPAVQLARTTPPQVFEWRRAIGQFRGQKSKKRARHARPKPDARHIGAL